MKTLIGFVLVVSLHAQVLSYSQQPAATGRVSLWEISVDPCPAKPISFATLRRVAVEHGLQPWNTNTVTLVMARKSLWGKVATYALVGTTVAAAAAGVGFITANAAIKEVLTGVSTAGTIGTTLAKAEAPTVDTTANQGVAIAATGCTLTLMYAAPSQLAAFSAPLPGGSGGSEPAQAPKSGGNPGLRPVDSELLLRGPLAYDRASSKRPEASASILRKEPDVLVRDLARFDVAGIIDWERMAR
jgi:hypothetical protein